MLPQYLKTRWTSFGWRPWRLLENITDELQQTGMESPIEMYAEIPKQLLEVEETATQEYGSGRVSKAKPKWKKVLKEAKIKTVQ